MGLLACVVVGVPAIGSSYCCELGAGAAAPRRFQIAINQRKVDGAVKTVRVTEGDAVELVFTGDEPAELHLHGYDLTLMLEPGVPASLSLTAKIAGRFPIEAHRFGPGDARDGKSQREIVLVYLEVYPR